MDERSQALVDSAARPFAAAGRFALGYARGKLRHDPVYLGLLRGGLIPDRSCVLDLGCGQGILLALLAVACEAFQRGNWPRSWPAAPRELLLQGIERTRKKVDAARRALGTKASVRHGDLRETQFTQSSVIVLLDVLHYLDEAGQRRLLERSVQALRPNGCLLVREADAARGAAFAATRAAERIAATCRGHLTQHFHYRSTEHWTALLESLGLNVSAEPMSQGTPFANVLLVARRERGESLLHFR
jgi:trans-aconitate methyltransferase